MCIDFVEEKDDLSGFVRTDQFRGTRMFLQDQTSM